MSRKLELSIVMKKEGAVYNAHCPELDITSHGATLEEKKSNRVEALELFYETASKTEISRRLHNEILTSRFSKSI